MLLHPQYYKSFDFLFEHRWVSHMVFAASFCLSFYVSLPITIVELILLPSKIRDFKTVPFRYRCSYSPVGLVRNDSFNIFHVLWGLKN